MQNFTYQKVGKLEEIFSEGLHASLLAGGTTLIDLMKLDVEKPTKVLDLNALPYAQIEKSKEGGLHIGALAKNSDLAQHPIVLESYKVLSEALLSGASAQLRNKATTAGNLRQRTRCPYFRNVAMPCNKRKPGTGCAAIQGHNRNLAILGVSEHCIANNPSDMNVAMMALEATIHVKWHAGQRDISMDKFFLLPGATPHLEHAIKANEFITGVTLPKLPEGTVSYYLKLRDRASYEFALASAAIVAKMENQTFTELRIAMGGIGSKPWRSYAAEKVLVGAQLSPALFRQAAEAELANAQPQTENGFKVELAKRCLVQALKHVTETIGSKHAEGT